jgi:GT2 family glycosyltransferase
MTIGFEILHYQTSDDTIACVESIKSNVAAPVIVIVDNASPNGSGRILSEYFKNESNVHVILLNENVGFARGNNTGYKFIRDNYNCEFICCINNDTELICKDFEEKLRKLYSKDEFAVMAPKVLLKDGSIQSFNPILHDISYYEGELETLMQSEEYSQYLKKKGILTLLICCFPKFMGIVRKVKQKLKPPYRNLMRNVVLHGCFLVFSNTFITLFEEPFDPRTFMFREEELLYIKVRRKGLLTVYSENICVKHKEDAATDSVYKKREDKYQFMRKNQIKSIKILIEELRIERNE